MKHTKHLMLSFAVAAATVTLVSCSDDNAVINPAEVEENEKVTALTAINKQYIEGTVYPTYALLADSTACLFDALHAIKLKLRHTPETLTDAEVAEACETFLRARSNYETSEAFLYGAASDFGIDPHIDSWPLDLQGLAVALTNTAQIAAMDTYEEGGQDDPERFTGDTYAGEKLGQALLGFHGIEFILFREGKPRTADDLRGTDNYSGTALAGRYAVSGLHEIIFATAVAGDLRNKCWQMEVSWNANAPAEHIAKVEDMEWPYTLGGSGLSYGENFLRAGQQGSTYASVRKAVEAILVAGCANIADEVGMTKIGKPHTGEDVNYIESPYSHMSLVDFQDNILGIENAYMGGRLGTHRNETLSLHAYMQKHHPELDAKVVNAIAAAKQKIAACPAPFVLNYTDARVAEASAACTDLSDALIEASNAILRE